MNKFTIINENYKFKDGEVIIMFRIDDNPREYVLYALDDYSSENNQILISYLDKDNEGYDILKNVENYEERKKVINTFKEILKKEENYE